MPHTTSRFPLERRVLKWAGELSQKMTGASMAFFAVIDAAGAITSIHLGDEARRDETQASWVFFDPFDLPEYCYLEWRGVKQATMERLIGEAFTKEDFLPWLDSSGQGALKSFPESWSVMF